MENSRQHEDYKSLYETYYNKVVSMADKAKAFSKKSVEPAISKFLGAYYELYSIQKEAKAIAENFRDAYDECLALSSEADLQGEDVLTFDEVNEYHDKYEEIEETFGSAIDNLDAVVEFIDRLNSAYEEGPKEIDAIETRALRSAR